MKKFLAAAAGILLILTSLAVPSAQSADSGAAHQCIGAPADDPGAPGLGAGMYPEPRTFLEAQSWWPDRATHAHLGACLPADQTFTTGNTVVTSNWRIDMHEMTGYLYQLVQAVATDGCNACGETATFTNTDSTKLRGPGIFWVTSTFDIGVADKSGWQQVKNRFEIKVYDKNGVRDGSVRPAVRYMANIQHGKTQDPYNRADTNGYGWHTNTAYAYARLKSSTASYSPTLPYAPVKGNYSFTAAHTTTSDGVSKNITGWMVSVDPKLHASPPSNGTVLGSGDTAACTPYVKGTCNGPSTTWTIDTTKLTDGVHYVAIFTHQKDSTTKENTGVLKYPFIVANGPAPAPAPAPATSTTTAPAPAPTPAPTTTSAPAPAPAPTAAPAPATTVAPAPVTASGPAGPAGTWTPAFADEFNGTALDPGKWRPNWYGEAGVMNKVTTNARNVSVTGGELRLKLESTTSGALVHTDFSGGYKLPKGSYVEARVFFAGNPDGTNAYNWPAWWVSSDLANKWPNSGEHDVAEVLGVNGLGKVTVNYHSPTLNKNMGEPAPGRWANGWHTYGIHRLAGSADIYYDGVKVRSYATADNGAPEILILNHGKSDSRGQFTGDANAMRVDWVRAWRR